MSEETIAIKRSDLEKILLSWEQRARRLFWDAPKDESIITATQAMEHDAIVFANHAEEISQLIGRVSPQPSLSGTKEGDQK